MHNIWTLMSIWILLLFGIFILFVSVLKMLFTVPENDPLSNKVHDHDHLWYKPDVYRWLITDLFTLIQMKDRLCNTSLLLFFSFFSALILLSLSLFSFSLFSFCFFNLVLMWLNVASFFYLIDLAIYWL